MTASTLSLNLTDHARDAANPVESRDLLMTDRSSPRTAGWADWAGGLLLINRGAAAATAVLAAAMTGAGVGAGG
jgi:hypothetical protein